MLPDRVSNPGPLTYESGALPIALRGPARFVVRVFFVKKAPGLLSTSPASNKSKNVRIENYRSRILTDSEKWSRRT